MRLDRIIIKPDRCTTRAWRSSAGRRGAAGARPVPVECHAGEEAEAFRLQLSPTLKHALKSHPAAKRGIVAPACRHVTVAVGEPILRKAAAHLLPGTAAFPLQEIASRPMKRQPVQQVDPIAGEPGATALLPLQADPAGKSGIVRPASGDVRMAVDGPKSYQLVELTAPGLLLPAAVPPANRAPPDRHRGRLLDLQSQFTETDAAVGTHRAVAEQRALAGDPASQRGIVGPVFRHVAAADGTAVLRQPLEHPIPGAVAVAGAAPVQGNLDAE